MAKKSSTKLPTWAKKLWEDMGSPDIDAHAPIHYGDLLDRRHGLRRDDLIELYLHPDSFTQADMTHVRGRLVSSGKSSLEILTEDGRNLFVAREFIVQIELIAHTRPAYIDDDELLAFERDDMKRRSSLHEKVEKESSGNDDSHLWG